MSEFWYTDTIPSEERLIMLNDDEQYYMEREFTGCDWRDSAPIEYITESEDYYSDEDETMDVWDDPNDYDIGGNEPEDDPYASEWREDEDICDHY